MQTVQHRTGVVGPSLSDIQWACGKNGGGGGNAGNVVGSVVVPDVAPPEVVVVVVVDEGEVVVVPLRRKDWNLKPLSQGLFFLSAY